MKRFSVCTGHIEDGSQWDTHYIDCNTIEQISAFAVKIEGKFTIIFMHPVVEIKMDRG